MTRTWPFAAVPGRRAAAGPPPPALMCVRAPAWRVPHPLIGDHEAAPLGLHLRTRPALGRATAPHQHKRVLVGWSWRTANRHAGSPNPAGWQHTDGLHAAGGRRGGQERRNGIAPEHAWSRLSTPC
jgi:hypothetical protein